MRSIRLAAQAIVLLLLDLCMLQAERIGTTARDAGEAPGASWGRGAGRGLAAAFLLGTAHVAGETMLDGPERDAFVKLDTNGDKRVSQEEYGALLTEETDEATRLHHMTMFFEADIDGDGLLSLQEYVFSRYLVTEPANRKVMKMVASKLPKDYIKRIDDMFLDLRTRFAGKVRYQEVDEALWKLLGVDEPVPRSARKRLRDMFEVADVIPDGVLNVNELDFLHFMVREDLISMAVRPATGGEEFDKQIGAMMAMCDKNKDGRVDQNEVIEALEKHMGKLNFEEQGHQQRIAKAFRMADRDRDGSIDSTEAPDFFKALSGAR